jgi:hypothetical protein
MLKDELFGIVDRQIAGLVHMQNNQGKPVKPSAVCILPSGSAEWLPFNNCVAPPPDGEHSLYPMLVAPKCVDHLDSMTPFTRFHRLITGF